MSSTAVAALLCGLLAAACDGGARARMQHGEYRVYVSNEDSNDVSVLDSKHRRVIATIPVGKRPRGLCVDVEHGKLYVAVSGWPKRGAEPDRETHAAPDRAADGIAVVDLAKNALERVLPSGIDPEAVDLTNDGKALYVSNEGGARVTRVDVARGVVSSATAVGAAADDVAVHPSAEQVYVTSRATNSVSVIDTHSSRSVATLSTGERPRAVAFSADGTRAYVANEASGSITIIDAGQVRVLRELPLPLAADVPARPLGVVVSPDGKTLYVSNGEAGSVAIIDLEHGRVERTTQHVGAQPRGIALSPDGRELYTANGPSNDVSVLDTRSGRVLSRVKVGASPWGVAIGPTR